jgi:hypothetical protein
MQNYFKWIGVGCDYYQLRNSAIKRFCSLVSAFLDLLDAGTLPYEVVDH